METHYSTDLIAISYIIASLGSLMALLINRDALLRPEEKRSGLVLLASICLGGVGIWSMHFIGMLAMNMPGMEICYNWWLTVLSFVVGVFVVYLGLFIMSQGKFGIPKLVVAGFIVGLGVAAMHYTGMFAMQLQANFSWNWEYIAASLVIAITASIVALWLSVYVKKMWQMVLSALVMGVAVCGMHYTGMAAVSFEYDATLPSVTPVIGGTAIVTLSIVLIDIVVLFIAAITAMAESNKRTRLHV